MSTKNEKKNDVLKRERKSGLASFVQRPLPEEAEVVDFEKAVNRELRDQEIDSHLNDVYSDKKGKRVDVSKLNIKKRPHLLLRIFKNLLFLAAILYISYFAYSNYFANNNDISSMTINLSAPEKVIAGDEFYYEVEYHNPSKYVFTDIVVEMQYPNNFVFQEALFNSETLNPNSGNYGFNLPPLAPNERGKILVKGYIINSVDSVNLAVARLTYTPDQFSSQFKKEDSSSVIIGGVGFRVDTEVSSSIFLEQESEFKLFISGLSDNLLSENLNSFDVNFNFTSNSAAEVKTATTSLGSLSEDDDNTIKIERVGSSWRVSGLENDMSRQEIIFKFEVKNSVEDFDVEIVMRKRIADKDYVFWQKTFEPELITSDLSLGLILNASKNNQALNFGDTLNYTLNYSNKGTKSYKDVVIMAVLEGAVLDWDSINISQNGKRSVNSIIWSSTELDRLSEIRPGQSGELNFSIKLNDFNIDYLTGDTSITSYARYSVSGQEIEEKDGLSNRLTNPINSDLKLSEEIRYFNQDNYPVGSGPLPPEVDEKTEFRVYWTVENNLHELRNVIAYYNLPDYLAFERINDVEVGNMFFDSNTRRVIWEIGLMPTSKYRLDSSFTLSLTPEENDFDKILILSSGSTISAIDTETGSEINLKTGPKTTRLEDDEIAAMNNNGRIKSN